MSFLIQPGRSPVEDILKLTGGRGVDVAFEAAGADETPEQAAEVVRPGGKVIVTGIPKDDSLSFNAFGRDGEKA